MKKLSVLALVVLIASSASFVLAGSGGPTGGGTSGGGAGHGSNTFTGPQTISPSSTSSDALDINMPAATTGNSIAVKNSANQTLFAVPGGADSGHNSSQVASLAAIPIDTVNDAFFANIPATDTAGNCFVCQENSVTRAAIDQHGELFSSPTETNIVPIQVSAPSGQSASLLDMKVNSVSKFTIDSTGTVTAGSLKWVWLGGSNAVLSNTATASYFSVSGLSPAASIATFGNVQTISSGSYNVVNLHCVFMGTNGTVTAVGGTSYQITLQKNGSNTAQTCTATTAQSSCSDPSAGDAVSIAANDVLNYTSAAVGSPTALEAKCSVEVHG